LRFADLQSDARIWPASCAGERRICVPDIVYQTTTMTLTELKYLVAVARERHFGRAAQACFVSQPTLSVSIRKLEEELSVTIFERGGLEISVTPISQRVAAQAQKVLEESEQLRESCQPGPQPTGRPLARGRHPHCRPVSVAAFGA